MKLYLGDFYLVEIKVTFEGCEKLTLCKIFKAKATLMYSTIATVHTNNFNICPECKFRANVKIAV